MAHQTGIEPSNELVELMSEALRGTYRYFQVKIKDEKLVPGEFKKPVKSWDNDLDPMLQPILEKDSPCYVFYRLDTYNIHQNYLWIFMSYTPDFSPVKLKMLYAATKASLRKSFDSSAIVDDIAATSKDELSLDGYRQHEEARNAAPPLTDAEMEMKEIRENEHHSAIGTSTKQSHIRGVAFPVQPDAMHALGQFRDGTFSYVQLSIDVKKEIINLEVSEADTKIDDLPTRVPDDSPRYHLFHFRHTHEGDFQDAIVFLYSCPGFKSSVKERMLYSSCKEPLVCTVDEELGITITKKIEITSGNELTEDFIMDEVHPKKTIVKSKFLKPKPPSNRRPKSPIGSHSPGNLSPVNGE